MTPKQLRILKGLIDSTGLSEGQVMALARDVAEDGALVGLAGLTERQGDRLIGDIEFIAIGRYWRARNGGARSAWVIRQ